MSTLDDDDPALEFPLRQHMRLQVSLVITSADGSQLQGRNSFMSHSENTPEQALRAAQAEVVEQEIFSVLIREASSLPTASARVSERLIAIEAAHATELRFELVNLICYKLCARLPLTWFYARSTTKALRPM